MTKYEFTEEQNIEILKLARYMKYTGILVAVFGVLALVFSIVDFSLLSIIYFTFLILAGISFYLPTDNLQNIAETEGSDIEELMQAFKELYMFWNVIIGLLVILFILGFF